MFHKNKTKNYKYKLGINGMRCGMCEAHINNIIRQKFNVQKVKSNHKKNETIVFSLNEIDINALREVISQTGYELTDIVLED